MTPAAPIPYRVSLRLYVVFSLLMLVSAALSGLLLLYLARPFVSELSSEQAGELRVLLFSGAAAAGALAAVGGLLVGGRFAERIRGIVERAEALAQQTGTPPPPSVRDEISALDAAVGRLTLSMDRFIRDSDILARLPEGMLFLDARGQLVSFNPTAEALLGLRLERYRGLPILGPGGAFPLAAGNEPLARLLQDVASSNQKVHVNDVSVTPAGGAPLLLEVTAQRRDWGPDCTAHVLVFRDASEKRRIRDEIRRADQLAFLGGMAAKIAHEIRTPLATIRGLLELLQADLPKSDPRRQYIHRVLQSVDRQDRLVENLLTLGHPEPETWQAVSIPELLEDLVAMLPQDPRLHVAVGDPARLPAVWGDPFRLGEVLTNLIKNGLEAAGPDGTVHVWAEQADGDRVRVAVRNSGSGIPPELRERIFQPFFTTKSRGTGLGLAIARHIVEAHRGRVSVESDGRSETTFVVELPTSAPALAGEP
jgi:signal transduction histidine kinase